jgi:flavodoxin
MEPRKTLLIVYHSLTNGTLQMAEAARAGAPAARR